MIEKIFITQYRKLINIDIELSSGINVFSGANGTCKTSLLHIMSNSFQKFKKTNAILRDKNCINIINSINNDLNPKIEALTKGDKMYNDPARGIKGELFSVNYFDTNKLNFRKHNSPVNSRYSIKPNYKTAGMEKLPELPVIYLGLSRLYAYGEYQNDENIKEIKKKLPYEYQEEINKIYKDFTGIDINYVGQQKVGDIKIRAEFSSKQEGVDSNTISAGEDNLYIIITSLVSLKYYYENINSLRRVESMLLIDEIDATLHPAYQVKLLKLMEDFTEKYKIQIAFTTHSLFLIENALKAKQNVIYLIDNIKEVYAMQDVDIYKIKKKL